MMHFPFLGISFHLVFCPFNLVSKVVTKVISDKVDKALLEISNMVSHGRF